VNTPLRLLHLEDDDADADIVRKTLENEGVICTVTRVETETDFRSLLAQGGVDLILADYTLPEFDGISALNLARTMLPDVPFIFLSGTLDEEVAIDALKIGATDYVFKTRLSRIAPAVRRALREAQERIALQRSEAAIRASEKSLRLIVDRIPGLVSTMTAAGNVEHVNQRILDYTGKTIEELQDWRALIHPDDFASVMTRWLRSIATGRPYEVEHRILGADGVYRWFYVHGLPMLDADGHIVRWYTLITDIDQRKKAEEKLQRSEAFLAEAQSISHTGSFGWRVSTGEIIWSEETFRIFQYDLTIAPTVEHILQRVHPEDAALVTQTVERASRDGMDFEHEYRLVMPDRSIRHVHVVARAVRDEAGRIEFVGAVMDVTGQKQDELLLAGEKRLLEMIARGTPRTVILDALCRLVEELSGGTLSSILLLDSNAGCLRHGAAPSLPPAYIEAIDGLAIGPKAGSCGTAAYRGEPVVVSDIAADPLWADYCDLALAHGLRACWSTPIRSSEGKVLGTFAIYYREPRAGTPYERNIVERVTHLASIAVEREQAEEAQLRLMAIAASSDDAIISKTLGGIITSWNAGAQRIFGYTAEEAVGRPIKMLIPPDREDEESQIIDRLRRGESVEHFETVRILKDGRQIHVSLAISPIKNSAGQIIGAAKIARDITEQKRAEEALRQSQAELAHVSRVTTMGELTVSLAHEVNQPIAAALTNAKTCMRWLARDSPNIDEAREAAMRIVEDGTRASDIISRVRLLFEKGRPERTSVDVNELIREMIVLLRSEALRDAIAIRTELAADCPSVMSDRVQLQQVLMNLIVNGIDAMKHVQGARELVIASQCTGPDQVRVSVSDTGVGLPPQTDQIFKPFFTTKPHGTGMGLSISRSIVESHGGRLWATENPSRGATFHVALPVNVDSPP
jgi:PAS domain S-box-containing protein